MIYYGWTVPAKYKPWILHINTTLLTSIPTASNPTLHTFLMQNNTPLTKWDIFNNILRVYSHTPTKQAADTFQKGIPPSSTTRELFLFIHGCVVDGRFLHSLGPVRVSAPSKSITRELRKLTWRTTERTEKPDIENGNSPTNESRLAQVVKSIALLSH